MTGVERMRAEEVVGYLLEGEGVDVVRESLTWMCEQLMEAEVSELIGAERGERAPGERLAHRNGYRPRRWDTRAGELELAIPKIGRGSYFPSFLEPRKRSEQALVSVVGEADVAGVSTRRVDQVVESLGLRISKSEVSRICEGLDEHLDALRNRPLEGAARICGSMRRSRRSRTPSRASGACSSGPGTGRIITTGRATYRSTSPRPPGNTTAGGAGRNLFADFLAGCFA